jgi:hypothetical protein
MKNKICLLCPAKVITNNPCPTSFVHEGISLEEFLLIQAAKICSSFLRDGGRELFSLFSREHKYRAAFRDDEKIRRVAQEF